MTNDQPSPTNPTQTPPSEPESSTGHDQLEWTEDGASHWRAVTEHGAYAAYAVSPHHPKDTGWQTIYQPRSTVDMRTVYLLTGQAPEVGPAEAKAAAQQHHKATRRRLAWEQYMRDNDPPPPRKLGCCDGGPQCGHAWNCPTLP